jgi:hypothetical protein
MTEVLDTHSAFYCIGDGRIESILQNGVSLKFNTHKSPRHSALLTLNRALTNLLYIEFSP